MVVSTRFNMDIVFKVLATAAGLPVETLALITVSAISVMGLVVVLKVIKLLHVVITKNGGTE